MMKYCLILSVFFVPIKTETFSEELFLKPLANGDLSATFNFVTLSKLSKSRQHFDLMPRLAGELIDDHKLEEVDISLSRGVWRSQHWGLPPRSSGIGAQVMAIFNSNVQDVSKSWKKLTNALAGQFCASLNFLDSTQSINPKWSFGPKGIMASSLNKSHIIFGMLPGENVCTENLTPWKKLLPCGAKRGLSTFLNADHIHATKYHSLGLSLRKICSKGAEKCSDPDIELSLYVVLVFDPMNLKDNLRMNERESSLSNWSIRTLFGIGITSACPLATHSLIYIDVSNGLFDISPANQENPNENNIAAFDTKKLVENGINNLNIKYKKPVVYGLISKPLIHATRYVSGHGNEKGGIVTKIFNEDPHQSLKVVYLDILPWFLRIYLHTLKIQVNDHQDVQPLKVFFKPGVDRTAPYTLEMVLEIPAKSHLKISIGFEKSLLKWLEYPPDANKGFYVNSALISTVLNDKSNFTGIVRKQSTYQETFKEANLKEPVLVQIYTESLLVNLPTPDFSMPYNVICLTCTIVALAFGPLVNITTKSLSYVSKEELSEGFLSKLKKKIKSMFSKGQDEGQDSNKAKDE